VLSALALLIGLSGCVKDPSAMERHPQEPTPLNAAYPLEPGERPVQLSDGRAEVPAAPGSAAVVSTRVWGEPAMADLTGDGRDDAALFLVQERGGSGTFYYLAVAIREDDGFRGVDGVLLGDRIDPQRIDADGSRIVVRYLDRARGEAMAVPPSHPRERSFVYESAAQRLAVVARDFEGEADPARMRLTMKTWVWQRTQYNNDTVETPNAKDAFTIRFTDDQRVEITTDCNNMQGEYETDGNRLSFSMLLGTLMHCEGSQERVFATDLNGVTGYLFTGRGELVLELKYDTGSMIFR
jgi:heat shock protein HslJ